MKRSEIWLVDLNPTSGAEISKVRPVIIISSDAMGALPLKLCAPITGWQDKFQSKPWLVRLTPDEENKLSKDSAVDVLQLRGLDTKRFVKIIGIASSSSMTKITRAIAITIEF